MGLHPSLTCDPQSVRLGWHEGIENDQAMPLLTNVIPPGYHDIPANAAQTFEMFSRAIAKTAEANPVITKNEIPLPKHMKSVPVKNLTLHPGFKMNSNPKLPGHSYLEERPSAKKDMSVSDY